ncbi:MAG: hypothetical protein V3S51_07770 [Dehalococcoidia bacterium]
MMIQELSECKNISASQANSIYYEAWVRLCQMSNDLRRQWAKELAQIGISMPEVALLSVLHNSNGYVTPAEVSRWLQKKRRFVTTLLRRREVKGLVTIAEDRDGSGLPRICMTDKGRKAYEHSLKRESVLRTISCLSKSEKQQLETTIRAVLQAMVDEPTSSDQS